LEIDLKNSFDDEDAGLQPVIDDSEYVEDDDFEGYSVSDVELEEDGYDFDDDSDDDDEEDDFIDDEEADDEVDDTDEPDDFDEE
ncbi:MAG: hypothetical protein RSA99_06035, partial [Oscillospiraceae bacterium]